ncbi:hypothetical protein P170DRAFT_463859 [Aspergillus steynii IBT 23096]|uniref:Rhodopsin domain-containing protein n=1 Tax=Aspergillus steynii IBT 23096 TaxID=1392250 RepID=A0A2I2GCY1_9EURO|nr:uncharacterized protein P170DRAFT_463859 [Aspergillus steynii IBT 23096]PLB50739.1 hypothetical protein P170DRAFT_463859 [Aspergillus steynii IBT 23096]
MPRFAPDSWNPAVNITSWFLMSSTALCVMCRLVTKWLIFRKLTMDDYFVIISLAFCIGNTIALSMATANGYGDHTSIASRAKQDAVMKSQFAATLLFIVSLLFSKISMTRFIHSLSPTIRDRRFAHVIKGLVVVTGLTAFLGIAFQCRPPRVWDYMHGQCIDEITWLMFTATTTMITDFLIILQAMLLIVHIQATLQKKALFASIFLPRVLVIASALTHLILAQKASHADPFISTAAPTICMQITQSLSIVTACWGQLKPFLDRIRSDAFKLSGAEWTRSNTSSGAGASRGYRSINSHSQSRLRAKDSTQGLRLDFVPESMKRTKTMISGGKGKEWDKGSQSSETCIIRETRSFAIAEENAGRE